MPKHSSTIALVTGAAHGIGRAIVLHLAREGAAVAVIDLDAAGAVAPAALLTAEGHRAFATSADITDMAGLTTAIDSCEAALGPITLLVNNAAFTDAGNLGGIGLQAWHREVDVNLNGSYHCLRALLPRMQTRGAGVVVNSASVNGLRYFGNPAYSAAKAGLINLTQSVASEYGRFGIRCNAVLQGSVRQKMPRGKSASNKTRRCLKNWRAGIRWAGWLNLKTSPRRCRFWPRMMPATSLTSRCPSMAACWRA